MVWLLWAKNTKTKLEKNPHFQLFSLIYCNWNQTVPYESNREENVTTATATKRQKSNRFRLAKQQLRTCTKFFCPFLCRQARLWRELPISRFIDDVNMRGQISLSTPNYPLHKLDLYARANMRRRLSFCRCLAGITVTPGGIRLPRSYPRSFSPFSHWFSKTGQRSPLEEANTAFRRGYIVERSHQRILPAVSSL